MKKHNGQYITLLHEVSPQDILRLWKDTINAIISISAAYLAGVIFFAVMILLKSEYWFFAFVFPLFCSLWLDSFGAKHVNNHYRLKKFPDGIVIYKKDDQNYTTVTGVHAVIFIISLPIRLIREIRNLTLIKIGLKQEIIQ